jgi:hypothetical protein
MANVDYNSLNIRVFGATYIHSSINNFNAIYDMHKEEFEDELKDLALTTLKFLKARIDHLRSLREAYVSLILNKESDLVKNAGFSSTDSEMALDMLNQMYN